MKDASGFLARSPRWWQGIPARLMARDQTLSYVWESLSEADCADVATLADAARAVSSYRGDAVEFLLVTPLLDGAFQWEVSWPLARRGRQQPSQPAGIVDVQPGGRASVLAKIHAVSISRGRRRVGLTVSGRGSVDDAIDCWSQVARSVRAELRDFDDGDDDDDLYVDPGVGRLYGEGLLVLSLEGTGGLSASSSRVFRWRRRYWAVGPFAGMYDGQEPVECRTLDEVFWEPYFQVLSGTEEVTSSIFDDKFLARVCSVADETPDGHAVRINGVPYRVEDGVLVGTGN